MDQVHDHLEMPELSRDFGTQVYEQQVVEQSQAGERAVRPGEKQPGWSGTGPALAEPFGKELSLSRAESRREGAWSLRPCASYASAAAEAGLQDRRVYALHLRRYNDALLIHDTVRAVDAVASLQDFYDTERTTKTQVLLAERWLLALFDGEAHGNRTRVERQARAQVPVQVWEGVNWGPIFLTKSQSCEYDKKCMLSFVKVCIDRKLYEVTLLTKIFLNHLIGTVPKSLRCVVPLNMESEVVRG